jgi:FeS assembly protein IscX
MGLRWTDTIDIAIELTEAHPDVDPQWIRFTDLHAWVCALPDFSDDPNKSTEGLLEAIQMAWLTKFVKNLSEISELLDIQADY